MTTKSTSFWSHIPGSPATSLGKWAVGLALASFVLNFLWSVMPFHLGAFPSFLCGIIGGILALIAVTRLRDRSLLVYLAILPLISVIVFILAEFLLPH